MAAGVTHSLALRADGTVVGWGYNLDGEATGVPTPYWPPYGGGVVRLGGQILSNVVAIAACGYHSLALKADGTVVGWGVNWSGASAIAADATNVVAIAAGEYHGLALGADGSVTVWGGDGQFSIPLGATNVVAVAAYGYNNLVLRVDGTIIGWGVGSDAQTDIPAYGHGQPKWGRDGSVV